jgi:hypothetical protein
MDNTTSDLTNIVPVRVNLVIRDSDDMEHVPFLTILRLLTPCVMQLY